jgi:hypothetical protein
LNEAPISQRSSGPEPRARRRRIALTAQTRQRVAVTALTILLCAWTFVYRFNTLGGRFGGFENDHFVSFAYAKQVQGGAQPLRDFAGLGLQGAWPSLTYELSAAAQRLMGDNLRSEAVLTSAGVALAAALTFLAAVRLSTPGWALVTTLLSVFIAPTLYNYTKVLPFAAAALAIVSYVRRPTLSTVAAAAAASAVAFLFRHDLAAYIGAGVLAALIVGPPRLRRRHAAAYALFTLVLLTPSLIYVQYYDGIVQYLRDGLALSQREAERTPFLQWPTFALGSADQQAIGFFALEGNATAWLFYMTWLLVPTALLLVYQRPKGSAPASFPAVLALAVTTLFAARFLLRGNIAARLGDVGPLLACLLAYVCYTTTRARAGDTMMWRTARAVPVLLVLAGTAVSAGTVGSVSSQLRTGRLTGSWRDAWQHTKDVSRELMADPQAEVDAAREGDPLRLAQYLNRCTEPTDRIVLMAYRPELLPFAGRLFGAGRLTVMPAYVLDERYQRAAVAWWQRERAPVALVEFEAFYDRASTLAPMMRDFLLAHYSEAGIADPREGRPLKLFVRRDLAPKSSFGTPGLPCFR